VQLACGNRLADLEIAMDCGQEQARELYERLEVTRGKLD